MQQALTSPNANNPHALPVMAIYDPKRRMDELTQKGLIKLGDDTPQVGMISQLLDALKDFGDQAVTDRGHTLLCIPDLQVIEIAEGRFGETNGNAGHALLQSQPSFGLFERNVPPGLEVSQALHHGAHEGALLLSPLVIGHRLHDGDTSPTAREQHGPMNLGRVSNHSARIGLQIRQGN